MQETWRWFGPSDPVSLENIIQSGASGVVTSLHHIEVGAAWSLGEILKRKQLIEERGLVWSVVESVPVHNDIKLRKSHCQDYIEAYKETLKNLGEAGVKAVCYNFMPVVDWTRTNLMYKLPNESYALRFSMEAFVAYDLYILERHCAADSYTAEQIESARRYFESMSQEQIRQLESNIIAGLPGGADGFDRDGIRTAIDEYRNVSDDEFRQNLFAFLREVIPVAEKAGVRMCIHPDDPPFSLFGLPRVVSTADDARALLKASDSVANGLTLCAGSYGARGDNDLVAMVREFASRIHFVHLRNVRRQTDGSFYESEHLDGDNDMLGIVQALLQEEQRRRDCGRSDQAIPMRPDHGHLMADDIGKDSNPGYSMIGRLKGLAELRGVIHALENVGNLRAG
ncbi:mannonate dehydratase [Pseudomaricurvus alkylphenolicus]|jgi:mannonate dehydratase|uniref:mannonate dehydratase n=1 Tax=Pseudomaricurvus alkylphenolicus TaxID=1306991 RepID=UPI00142354FF|nr:mannonate dehydratase [Pseudomaricurvus alkylphenolicus]NIB40428.1 mannonate dehydratase [Pseudomaricurvus alkylphenolicus]